GGSWRARPDRRNRTRATGPPVPADRSVQGRPRRPLKSSVSDHKGWKGRGPSRSSITSICEPLRMANTEFDQPYFNDLPPDGDNLKVAIPGSIQMASASLAGRPESARSRRCGSAPQSRKRTFVQLELSTQDCD